MVRDEMGDFMLMLSPKKVELARVKYGQMGISHPIPLDTTSGMRTYRLVRNAGEMLVHLYIDDWPVPAIWDYHIGGGHGVFRVPLSATDPKNTFVDHYTLIRLGYVANPTPGNKVDAEIEFLRWHDMAYAPSGS